MTQQDRIEAMLRVVLDNQIQLAYLCYPIACKTGATSGTEATLLAIKAAAENAIAFSRAEQQVRG